MWALFSFPAVSARLYPFPPSCTFLFSPKDYDGQPLRHAEQKDVNEFCIHLMHKLERSSNDAGKLIQRVFGGTLVYQIVSRYPNRDRKPNAHPTNGRIGCTLNHASRIEISSPAFPQRRQHRCFLFCVCF